MGRKDEAALLKALDALEKGGTIPKEMRDANGGFATEGSDNGLQANAEEGYPAGVLDGKSRRKKVRKSDETSEPEESSIYEDDDDIAKGKAAMAEDESEEEEESPEPEGEEAEGEEESPEEGSEEGPPKKMMMKKKAKPKLRKAEEPKAEQSEGSEEEAEAEPDAEASEEASGERGVGGLPKPVSKMMSHGREKGESADTKKSLRKSMMEDEDNRELIEASSFLESLVDQTSDSVEGLSKSIHRSARHQHDFNQRMAKAMISLGGLTVQQGRELRRLRRALENTPATGHRKTVLTKSEVADRPFVQLGDGEGLDNNQFRKALDTLTDLSIKGKVPVSLVTEFELRKTLDVLPEDVVNMLGDLH